MKERYERELEGLRGTATRSQKELQQQQEAELEKLRQRMLADMAAQRAAAEEMLAQTKQVVYMYCVQ